MGNPVGSLRFGFNHTVLALSVARMADGIGNSILFVLIPLYVARMPDELPPLPRVLLIGILISAFGLANACLQPFMAGVLAIFSFQLPFLVDGALCLLGAGVVFPYMTETVDRQTRPL